MFETLYKTEAPKSFMDGGEYYQPSVDFEFRDGVRAFFVREKHGWWDEVKKEPANMTVTLSPDEGYPTLEEALDRYDQQLHYRASQGFVHAFSVDFYSQTSRFKRRLLDPNSESLLE